MLHISVQDDLLVLDEVLNAGVHGGDDDDRHADQVQQIPGDGQHQDDAHHGGGGLHLAGLTGGDDQALLHRHQAQAGDGELIGGIANEEE